MVFAVAGGNEIIDKAPGFAPGIVPKEINPISQMGIAFVTVTVNLAFTFLGVFIVGVWLFTTAYVLREEILVGLSRAGKNLKKGSFLIWRDN